MKNIYKHLHSNQKIFIYEMLKRGIDVEVINEEREIIKASYKGHDEFFIDRDSSIMPYNVSILAGDKAFTKNRLLSSGISCPLGVSFNVKETDAFIKAFGVLDTPVVIKPINGSHGYDVYINLNNKEQIIHALSKIRESKGNNTEVLIEEYYDAKEYRIFITKNRDYAVLLRDPAYIIGDGIHSIIELVERENYQRMHPRTNSLCEIIIDDESLKYIKERNMDLSFIPQNHQKVYLRRNSNVAMGGVSVDYTDKVHQSVIDIAMNVLSSFPGLPYVGIDYMTNSITEKQNLNSYRIIEINTVPGAHMHFAPAVGKSQNIAKYIIDMIYPETKDIEFERDNPMKRERRT